MFNSLRKLITILGSSDKIKLFILFCLMLLEALLEIISIGIIAGFISIVEQPEVLFENKWTQPFLTLFNIDTPQKILIYGAILLIVIFIFKNIYLVAFKYLKARFVYKRYKKISETLFELYMYAPYTFHLNRNSAELVRNISAEAHYLTERVMIPLLNIATESVVILAIVALLLFVEPVLSLVGLVLLGGINAFFLKMTRKRITYYGKQAQNERSKMIKLINEGIGGYKEIAIMNHQPWFLKRFKKIFNGLFRARIYRATARGSMKPIMETVAVTTMLLITLLLLWRGHSLTSLISILSIFALSIYKLLPAVSNLVGNYTEFKYHSSTINPIYQDFSILKPQLNKLNQKSEANGHKMDFYKRIKLENISYSYPDSDDSVLKNISLKIDRNSMVGLVGETGSGKTTLVNLILGLLRPDKGRIIVDDNDIHQSLRQWQNNIGYIPQFIYLTDDTIKNNIALGLDDSKIDINRLNEVVKMAQLRRFISSLPNGLDTVIGERGVRLSGGQRQRIGIARALYHEPELLIMDEATSSLDNITEKEVVRAIERIKQDLTIIVIAHRLTSVENCDTIFLMKNGAILDQGNYSELSQRNKEFKLMVDYEKEKK